MPIRFPITPARDVNPEILTVAGFHDQLVKVAIVLNPVKPLASGL